MVQEQVGADAPHRVEFVDAREFFAAVRAASEDIRRTSAAIERMRAREGVRAQGYSPATSGGGCDANRTDPLVSRMDYERRVSARVEAERRLVAAAECVIYGDQAGLGGVSALLGTAVADAMWWRYCSAEDWRCVADMTSRSESWCRQAVESALDVCDAYGIDAMRRGLGLACEG